MLTCEPFFSFYVLTEASNSPSRTLIISPRCPALVPASKIGRFPGLTSVLKPEPGLCPSFRGPLAPPLVLVGRLSPTSLIGCNPLAVFPFSSLFPFSYTFATKRTTDTATMETVTPGGWEHFVAAGWLVFIGHLCGFYRGMCDFYRGARCRRVVDPGLCSRSVVRVAGCFLATLRGSELSRLFVGGDVRFFVFAPLSSVHYDRLFGRVRDFLEWSVFAIVTVCSGVRVSQLSGGATVSFRMYLENFPLSCGVVCLELM